MKNQNKVAPERYSGHKCPEWLDTSTIPLINTDNPLITQYIGDNDDL